MQQFDLQPTDKNIQESITNDTTGRNFYLAKFITLLNNQTGPWSVALDASWGSGKTFFVKECQLVLKALCQSVRMKRFLRTRLSHFGFWSSSLF